MQKLAVLLVGISAMLFSVGCCGHHGGYGSYYGGGGGGCPSGNCGYGYPSNQNFLPPQGAAIQNFGPAQAAVPNPVMMAPPSQPVAYQPFTGIPFGTLPTY